MKSTLKLFFAVVFFARISFAANDDAFTKYPIVLIHGLFGYGEGLSLLPDYWSDIPEMLRAHGAMVYVAHVSQAHKVGKRGKQLYEQLRAWGHEKYNLVGHSHGGLDARFVYENFPDIVASVTTIGTPHHGSKVADYLAEKISEQGLWFGISKIAGNLLGRVIGLLSGSFYPQNAVRAIKGLTTESLADFNEIYPNGIAHNYEEDNPSKYGDHRLYSWGSYGVTVNSKNLFEALLEKSAKIFDEGELNDGLVGVSSMKFGKWLGAFPTGHHLVPICGLMCEISDTQRIWALDMFLSHAQRLKHKGL